MTLSKKKSIILKEIAQLINDFLFVNGINSFYEIGYTNTKICENIICTNKYIQDENVDYLNVVEAYLKEDTKALVSLISDIGEKAANGEYESDGQCSELLDLLFKIYNSNNNEVSFSNLDEIIKYNKELHLERDAGLFKLEGVTLLKESIDIKEIYNKSAVFIELNIKSDTDLDDIEERAKLYRSVRSIIEENKDVYVFILSKISIDNDNIKLYTNFSDKVELSKIDNHNYKLYLSKNIELSDDDLDF